MIKTQIRTTTTKPQLRCKSCKSRMVRPSRTKGFLHWIFSRFGLKPYRCLYCGKRFFKSS